MKKIFTLFTLLTFIGTTNLFAQQNITVVELQRPADYEYLSAPDSLGFRTPLKMPSSSRAAGQVLPYPIIFIHGLNSKSSTWNASTNFMDAQYGYTYGGRIDYCLNYDGSNASANTNIYQTGADIAVWNPAFFIQGDYYFVNFDVGSDGSFSPFYIDPFNVLSNQAAIVKQGVAVRDAITRVLQITGRDKVILMGHSMGGLAAREYLENPNIWQPDGEHHVAKLVTTGTPHGGSNSTFQGLSLLTGLAERSEAVRDLRTSYSYSPYAPGVYLFGGYENNYLMNDNLIGNFHNVDVNCNGIIGEQIVGLNQKSLYSDLDYSCIIGECTGCVTAGMPGDGVVKNTSANLSTYYSLPTPANIFRYYASATTEIHTDLTSQNLQNMQGLDEPNEYLVSYEIDFNTTYTGLTSVQPVGGYPYDYDDYKFSMPTNGNVSVTVSSITLSDLMVHIVDLTGNIVGITHHSSGSSSINFTEQLNSGNYYLEILGTPTSTSYLHPYNFILNYSSCPSPTSGFNASINGNTVTFTNVSTNATSYSWNFGNGNTSTSTNPVYTYPSVGTYTVILTASNSCGNSNATLTINLSCGTSAYITPQSSTTFCQGGTVVLSANTGSGYLYQWKRGTANVGNSSSYTANQSGSYTVVITANGCSVTSNAIIVTVNPIPSATITPVGSTSICQGSSVVLNANTGSGYSYQWKRGTTNVGNSSSYTANQSGSYTVVITANGCSATSSSISVTVLPPPVSSFTYSVSVNFVSFSNTSTNAISYLWNFGDGSSTSTAQSPGKAYATSGSYVVTLTVTNSCGTHTSSQVINVNCSTSASITPQGAATFCQGGSVTLQANTGSGYTYAWKKSGGTLSTSSSYTAYTSGSYTVEVTANGCTAYSTPITITVNSTPTISAGNDITIQQGDSTTLTATGGVNYQWSNGANVASTTVSPSITTTYSVTVADANGCTATDNVIVIVESCDSYILSSSSTNISAQGGNCNANLTTDAVCSWSVNAGGCIDWVTVNNPSGIGSATISFSVQQNPLPSQRTCFTTIAGNLFQIIQAAAVTDIEEISEIKNISLYPNPNNGEFTLSIESAANQKVNCNIFNSIGQLLLKREIETNTQTQFKLSGNAKGIYYLQLQTENRNYHLKVSVE